MTRVDWAQAAACTAAWLVALAAVVLAAHYGVTSRRARRDATRRTAAMLAAAGITVTEEGKRRARAKLAAADARLRAPRRVDPCTELPGGLPGGGGRP